MLNLIVTTNHSASSALVISDVGGCTGFRINGVPAPFEYGMKVMDGQMISKESAGHIRHMSRATLTRCHNCYIVKIAPHPIEPTPTDEQLAEWHSLNVGIPLYGTFPISAHVAEYKWDYPIAAAVTVTAKKGDSTGYTAALTVRKELTALVEEFDPHAYCVVDASFLEVGKIPYADVSACVANRELALGNWNDLPFRKVGLVRNPSAGETNAWAYVTRVRSADIGNFKSIFAEALVAREPTWALIPEGFHSEYGLVILPGSRDPGERPIPNNIIGSCNSRLVQNNWLDAYGPDWANVARARTPLFWFNTPCSASGVADLTTRAASASLETEGVTYLLVLRVFSNGQPNRHVVADYEVHDAPLGWPVTDDTTYLRESVTVAIPREIKRLLAVGHDPYAVADAMLKSLMASTKMPGTFIEETAEATKALLGI